MKNVDTTKLVRGMYSKYYGSWPVIPRKGKSWSTEATFDRTIAGLNVGGSGKIKRKSKARRRRS